MPYLEGSVKVGCFRVAQQVGNFLCCQVGLAQVFRRYSHAQLVVNLFKRGAFITKSSAQCAVAHIELLRDFLRRGHGARKIDDQLAYLVYQALMLVQAVKNGFTLLFA